MDSARIDTQQAYKLIRERIITLELAPGAPINDQYLAQDLDSDLWKGSIKRYGKC